MLTLMILVGRHLDGALPGEAHHAAGADAGHRGQRDRRRPPRPPRRGRRPATSSARSSTRSTAWPASWRPAAAGSSARRSSSRRKHQDVEGRRRYVETVLDRIATGVVSVDAAGRIRTWNSAASRLLGIDARRRRAAGVGACSARRELKPLATLIDEASRSRDDARPQEVAITRDGRELHLAVMTTPLRRDDGAPDGVVVVFDDVSPLIRAQKVAAWREVARRLAHEIKNPLTPIQLCAERLRRHFARRAGADARAGGRVHDDDRRRGRVAEGAGRRVLAVRAHAGAARRADRPARAARRRAGALPRALRRRRDPAALRRGAAAGVGRSRSRCGA